jgi:hypothetical protein
MGVHQRSLQNDGAESRDDVAFFERSSSPDYYSLSDVHASLAFHIKSVASSKGWH